MPDASPKDEFATRPEGELRQTLQIIRRRKLVFLVALIIVPLAALLVSLAHKNQYKATATLLFQDTNVPADAAARQAATNSVLIKLPMLAEQTARELGGSVTGHEVGASISVDVGSSIANIGKISATTNSPELSAQMANDYSQAFINLNGLDLRQGLQIGKARLVQPATPPSAPSPPKTLRNVVLGIILGVVLGFGLAALLERIDRRVRTVEELEELFGAPILARIPRSRKIRRAELGDVLQAPEADVFRTLRTNLRYFIVDRQLRSILVASPEVGDGRSTVARCLAAAMAEMGDNVVLVEADLRMGGDFRDANGQPAAGLSNALVSPLDLERLTRVEVQAEGSGPPRMLSILPSGPVPPNPGELLESERMRTLIAELQQRFEIVVIDSPPLGIVSDALALVPKVSGVLVAGGVGKTTRDGARNFTKQLSLLGTQPLGVAANFT
jgi:capsular exopolysaccharide synthesis family protein